jgi:hypothetical protein
VANGAIRLPMAIPIPGIYVGYLRQADKIAIRNGRDRTRIAVISAAKRTIGAPPVAVRRARQAEFFHTFHESEINTFCFPIEFLRNVLAAFSPALPLKPAKGVICPS